MAAIGISGAAIMDHARDLMLSEKWREAVRYLRESLEGFTLDHAASVLEGTMELNGDSNEGIHLEEARHSEGYREELDDIYGGLARIEGHLCRPYRVITTYGDRDAVRPLQDGEAEFVPENAHEIPDYRMSRDRLAARALHYADDRSDFVEFCEVPSLFDPGKVRRMAVLFRRAADVPMWIAPSDSPQKAVDARLDELQRDGFSHRYGSDAPGSEKNRTRMANQAKLNLAASSIGSSNSAASDMRAILDENLAAMHDRSPETFARRREEILAQNAALGFGLKKFDFGGEAGMRRVPLAPLAYWAIRRWSRAAPELPDWKPVSPQGVKQVGDDPVHSDWVTGAGLEEHIHELGDRQNDLMLAVQEEYLGLKVNVLVAGRRSAQGRVVHVRADTRLEGGEIAVIPDAGPKWYEAARTAAAVICQKGGAMSHLAQVGLEEGMLIVRVPGARALYPEGSVVEVDADRGQVTLVSFTDDACPMPLPGR